MENEELLRLGLKPKQDLAFRNQLEIRDSYFQQARREKQLPDRPAEDLRVLSSHRRAGLLRLMERTCAREPEAFPISLRGLTNISCMGDGNPVCLREACKPNVIYVLTQSCAQNTSAEAAARSHGARRCPLRTRGQLPETTGVTGQAGRHDLLTASRASESGRVGGECQLSGNTVKPQHQLRERGSVTTGLKSG